MIIQPEKYIEDFVKAGADILTVHVEACPHLHRTVWQIKESGIRVGVSLNPATSLSSIEEIIHDIDLILIMSVNPGSEVKNLFLLHLIKLIELKK